MYELGNDYKFPSPKLATNEGIVAIGGDLNPLRILEAYKNGIFPWVYDDENLICCSGLTKSNAFLSIITFFFITSYNSIFFKF